MFQNAVQNQLTGRNEDVNGFFRHGGTNPVSGGHIIEFEVPFEIRKRLNNYDMSLAVYKKAPNSISKKNLDSALESLKEVPSYERFVYPDSEGVLQLRQNIPAVGDFKVADQFNRVAAQFEDLRTGKITLKAMEEIIDRSIPISFAEPFRQIAQNIDRVTQQYLDGINKSPKGAEFNQAFRDTRAARDKMIDILRQMNTVNNDVNFMPKYRKALFERGLNRQDVREAYKPQVIGPRTGAKLYEKGGPVRAGIAEFIPLLQKGFEGRSIPNFIRRTLDPKSPMTEEGSTVRLMDFEYDGKYLVAPTIFPINTPQGPRLTELPGDMAVNHALQTGEFLQFDTPEEAARVAQGYSSTINTDRPKQAGIAEFIQYMK